MNSYRRASNVVHCFKKSYYSLKSLVKIVYFIVLCSYWQQINTMNGYPTYPTPAFHKVEKISKELLIDINALTFNNELYELWVEKSDYLFNQFLIFARAIDELVTNQEECRSYLLEDLHYLKEILFLVENSYTTISCKKIAHTSNETMFTIIQESKTKLDALYILNQEIVAS